MILLDTHIFIWWIDDNRNFLKNYFEIIKRNISDGISISIISLWEIVKLHEKSRIMFDCPIDDWISNALKYPGMSVIDLDVNIILESGKLPGSFHKDPADQLIVSTSRILDIPLCTFDKKIIDYPYVKIINSE